MQEMVDSLLEVISSAEYTASTGAKLVCLILTYSAIDTMSWLGAESDSEPVAVRYQRWVSRYMLPKVPALQCTAEELYAARCGILHTMTGDAALHEKKPLRRLAYACGSADAADMQKRIDARQLGAKLVAVHLEDLTAGLRLGTADFFEGLPADARLALRVEERSGRFYANLAADSFKEAEA
jgi:hypothetical protein